MSNIKFILYVKSWLFRLNKTIHALPFTALLSLFAVSAFSQVIPGIQVSSALDTFIFCPGTASVVQTFTVSGTGLVFDGNTDVDLTAPVGFEVRESGGTTFSTSLVLDVVAGELPPTSVDIRVAASADFSLSGGAVSITAGEFDETLTVTATVDNCGGPPTAPYAPTALVATPGNGQIVITFTPGYNGGSALTNYEYTLDGGTTWIPLNPADATSPITITGLTNLTSYTIQLRAVNAIGVSLPSSPVMATPILDLTILGCITVVASGGDTEGTTWNFAVNTISPNNENAVYLNVSDLLAKLALGNLTVAAKCITVSTTVTYSADANGITFKASDYVFVDPGITITTNGGYVIIWTDSDVSGDGAIKIGDNATINTANGSTSSGLSGNGRIVLAGGADDGTNGGIASDGIPDGFAASSSNNGVKLGTTIANTTLMYSGGGEIIIRGKSTLSGGLDLDRVGIYQYGKWTANSGKGAININGNGSNFYGINLVDPAANALVTDKHLVLISDKGSGDAITITGSSTSSYGVVFNYINAKEVLATGGGNIVITGTAGSNYGVFLQNQDILASSGSITVDGGTRGIRVNNNGARFGARDGTEITSSSANVVLTGNTLLFDALLSGFISNVTTTGTLTLQPSGDSFSSAFTLPGASLTFGSGISGLTIGKPSNTSKVTMGSTATIAGPINVYGGSILVSAALSAAGDILLDGDIGSFLSQNEVGVTVNGTVTTTNNGNITIQGRGGSVTNSGKHGVSISEKVESGGTGTINIIGYGGLSATSGSGSNHGINIEGANSWVKSNGGNVTLTGYGGGVNAGSYNQGVAAVTGKVSAGGTGIISINGTGGVNSVIGQRGVVLASGISIFSEGGAINITGNSGPNGTDNSDGVTIFGASIGSANSGPITISGVAGGGTGSEAITLIATTVANTLGAAGYAGDIILRGNSFSITNATTLSTSGKVSFESEGSSFVSTFSIPSSLIMGTNITELTIGKSTNTANVTIQTVATISGPINIYAGDVSIEAALTATDANIYLHVSGTVTQTAAITANGLGLYGAGTFTLTNTSNNVVTIAGGDNTTKLGSVSYVDASGGLTIGSVNPSGITASGPILIETLTGDITVSNSVVTTDTTVDAIIINAGKSSNIGTAAGGDIKISGSPTIMTGAGGIAKLFSGKEIVSTGLTTLAGGSSFVRYLVDETTLSFSPVLLADNVYALYRVANPVGLEVTDLQPFDFCPGIPSAVETFSVAGTNLSATVTITAPTGFEIRKTGDVAYDTMITLPIDINGTLSITSLEIRVAESATVTMTADISITSATDTVTLTVTATAAPPEIITVQGNNVNIFSGDDNPDTTDDTQFGTVAVNKPATKTYTIQNTGGRPLVVSAISLTGPDAAAFTVGDISLPATIPSGGSTNFTVTVNASTAGLKAANVVISSDDNCSVISQN